MNFVIKGFASLTYFVLVPLALIGQGKTKYDKESKLFLSGIRDSFLTSPKYARFIREDTLILREYLWNRGLFGAMVVAGNITQDYLEKSDQNQLMQLVAIDTAKYYLTNNFIKKTRLVRDYDDSPCMKLSKPLFLKNFTFCVISIGEPDQNSTFLFCRTNKNHWIFVKQIGYFTTY